MLDNLVNLIGANLKTFSLFGPILALLGGVLTSVSPLLTGFYTAYNRV